ncbi:uncharacterized protein N7487_007162 [Penicillium crustosum]|uniref:uncharacterized protein n=1 Tax=Penicillium crustosum TaxID=36656 RepID=UPI0023A29C3C|nr:uncharacterized protein N7487_007162 [Penicillium crustosum]KAJ5401266.1 hypothetical protein N7487_007162 [Penicillium crustosum]
MQFVRKAEEAITGKKGESHESTKSSNHGPHSSNLANKLDPRVDSDKDNRAAHTDATGAGLGTSRDTTTATGTHGTHGTHGTTYGATQGSGTTHGTSDVTGTGAGLGSTHGTTGSTNVGPHSSNIANKADPRVDSDRDNRARHEGLTGAGLGSTHGTTHGTSGVTGTGAGLGSTHGTTGSTNVGPHSSNIANKADPRVDSDRDNRARHEGLTGAGLGSAHGTTHGTSGLTGTGAGLGSTHDTTATGTHGSAFGSGTGVPRSAPIATPGSSSTNAGPHSSNIANKLDPRVDSDRDTRPQQQSTLGSTGTGTTTHGSHTRGATVGSAIGGSGLGTASHHDAPAGSSYNTPPAGTTTGTTGPHSSSIANKLDPRVDSDAARAQNEGLHRQI